MPDGAQGETSSHWVQWHRAYEEPGSRLTVRLRLVQEAIRAALAEAMQPRAESAESAESSESSEPPPRREIRIVSICAGQGRDVIDVVADLAGTDSPSTELGGTTLRCLLVELDPALVEFARHRAAAAGVDDLIDVVEGDASQARHYAPYLPADVVVVAGVFGNISDADIRRTIEFMPTWCAPGGSVVWTRHRREPDLTPAVREWFAAAGFEEMSFESPDDFVLTVGRHRLVNPPPRHPRHPRHHLRPPSTPPNASSPSSATAPSPPRPHRAPNSTPGNPPTTLAEALTHTTPTQEVSTMDETIHGTVMPVLELTLQPGESVVSEVGEFSWMTDAITFTTNMGGGMGGKGVMGALKRAVGGGSILMTTWSAQGGVGSISFAAKQPGHIVPIDVTPGNDFMVHRHGFMAATPGVELGVGFQQSLRGGIFGGMGFLLQKISGQGRAFVDLSGEVLAFDLVAGQSMRVHPGHVGLFQSSITFTIERVPGLVNRYMGDDGHHFAVMNGPGRIWLQSMPLPILAGSLEPYMPNRGDTGSALEGGAIGGMLGNLLK
ncbi:MAG TPA: AIM24 family protein [Acidimicrobiales bacterium]